MKPTDIHRNISDLPVQSEATVYVKVDQPRAETTSILATMYAQVWAIVSSCSCYRWSPEAMIQCPVVDTTGSGPLGRVIITEKHTRATVRDLH